MLTVSENTAANLLVGLLGGPAEVTAFVRTLGDQHTRLDRTEPDLNRGAPGDERDTTTPADIAGDVRRLVLGDGLASAARDRLAGWLVDCQTGGKLIRAGLPAGWRVGDKTGSGFAGETNDVAVVWPPGRSPWVIAVYTAPTNPKSTAAPSTIAAAAGLVAKSIGV